MRLDARLSVPYSRVYLLLSSNRTSQGRQLFTMPSAKHLLLVDPVVLSLLPGVDLLLLEPEIDLLLGGLDAVGAMADVAADVLKTREYQQQFRQRPRLLGLRRTIAKSPRIVPGEEASGFVAPSS